ncbi:stigma-specific peroxidase [Tanacetum coccineum]
MEIYSHIRTPFLYIVLLAAMTTLALGCTQVGFYKTTCPPAEGIVKSVVQSAIRSNHTIAPGLLRMFFHDCFVNGCDASILLDGCSAEKTVIQNSALRGFEVIQAAKSKLETVCPGVVSCADILALAARDSVVQSGGTSWEVPTGRRDGLVSRDTDATNLPGSKDNITSQIKKFADKGLSIQDLVTLVGGHTIGTAACARFDYRLHNYSTTIKTDPDIDQAFLPKLKTQCPNKTNNPNRVALDTYSETNFDNSYYGNLRNGRGVLESDSKLWSDGRTHKFVQQFLGSSNRLKFNNQFGRAMVKLSNVEVKTGQQGEIRRVCNTIN